MMLNNIFKKKQKTVTPVVEVITTIESMVQMKLCEINLQTYQVYIYPEAQWIGKTKKWKKNFCDNLRQYIDFKLSAQHGESADQHYQSKVEILDIETRTHIAFKTYPK